MELIEVKAERLKVKAVFIGFCMLLLVAADGRAQTFAEWFSQGKTQIKYLTQQIAALNAFESSVKQGYNMAKNEWGAIGEFKNGEFGLHQNYYSSLSEVNPDVKKRIDLTAIQSEQQDIVNQFNRIQSLPYLTASEQNYIHTVRQNILTEFGKDLNDLQTVLSQGTLAMSDDERIKRIDGLTAAIKDKYLFSCSFCTQVRLLTIQRNQDNQSTQSLNQLYGVN
jgi:hypothetical protein